MISWADAHRLAVTETLRLFRDQKVDTRMRIPLDQIAESLDLIVNYAPLPRMAGAYIAQEGSRPGILVNNRHPAAKQRYTLGHEIGHHVFGHATSLDADTELITTSSPGRRMPDHERLAEAFAAWLLMPRALIQRSVSDLALDSLDPVGLYRLSLLVGSSYVATCNHLVNLRLLPSAQAEACARVQPRSVKQQILGPNSGIGVGAADVHLVTRAPANTQVHVRPGDLIVITGHEPVVVDSGSLVAEVPRQQLALGTVVLRVVDMAVQNPAVSPPTSVLRVEDGMDNWSFTVAVDPLRQGVSETWFPATPGEVR